MLILLLRPSQVSPRLGVNLQPLYDLQRLTSVLVHTNLNFTLQIQPRPPANTTDVAFTTFWCAWATGVPSVVDNLCLSDVTHYMYIYSKQNADLSGECHAYQ